MLGTAFETQGGIAAVLQVYCRAGLFERWPIRYLATHTDRGVWRKLWRAGTALIRFTALLARRRVALIHVHGASAASFWRKSAFMLLAFATRRPVVFHLHGGGFSEFFHEHCGRVGKSLVRFVLARSARVIVLSPQWESEVRAMCPGARIVSIPNPVEVDDPSSDTLAGRRAHDLLFLGRLEHDKGIFDLLEALQLLRTEFPSVRLQCGGDGDVIEVKRRAETLGLGSAVRYLGWVRGDAKQRLLASSTVYVLPSYYEGLPMGVLEAMAAGLPVVATSVGGIPGAITDGEDGYLVPPGDIAALTETIRRLLRDPHLRQAIGAAGRDRVSRDFATPVILPRLEAIYGELGATPNPGGVGLWPPRPPPA